MKLSLAGELVDEIFARFKMLGMFTDDAMRRAYFNVLIAYDDDEAPSRTRKMLADNNQPCTERDLDIILARQETQGFVVPSGPRTDPVKGRAIMRRAWIDDWCKRHGGTEADFWAEDARLAAKERRPTLREAWARTDREIAAKKAKGMAVDESGLTNGAVAHSLREDLTPGELRRKEQAHKEVVGRMR